MSITEKKIINGIKYFVKKTKHVGRTKIFKLLFFWDFVHFKRFGKSVTGYDYYAYPFGPVPKKLYDQMINDELPDIFNENILIEETEDEDDNGYKSFKIKLRNKKIDYNCLTPNEKTILEEVAEIYRDSTANEMKEITHLPKTPWDKTRKEKGMFKQIDYFLALDDDTHLNLEEVKERFKLQKELMADGRI